jgi:hypothetical protein
MNPANTKCPVCGAPQLSVQAECAYCGSTQGGTLRLEEYIAAIVRRFEKVKKRDMIRAVQMLPTPSDSNALVELLIFCDGNTHNSSTDDELIETWFAKAVVAYAKLRLAGTNNPAYSDVLKQYSKRYSVEGIEAKKRQDVIEDNMHKIFLFLVFIGFPALVIIILVYIANRH